MNKYIKEIKLAIAAICAIVIVFYGVNFLKGINLFKSYNTYYVNFKDVTGLEESNAVYANGFPIGIVREIMYDYDNPENIKVKIEVDQKMKLADNSHAELRSALLGGTTMNVVLGDSKKYLEEEGSIVGFPETSMTDRINTMAPSIENILPKIDSIMTALNTLLKNPALNQTIDNSEYITGNLKVTTDQVNHLLKVDMPVLMAQMKEITTNTAGITKKFNDINYATTIQNVNETLESVNNISNVIEEKLKSKNNSLGLLVNDDELYRHLNGTIKNSEMLMKDADILMQDLKSHPKRYVHFSIFGKKDN